MTNDVIDLLDSNADATALKSALELNFAGVDLPLEEGSSFYILGNGGDFIEWAKKFALAKEDRVVGVACLWPHPSRDRRHDSTRIFSLPGEFVEELDNDRDSRNDVVLVVAQTFIADVNELILMISRVLSDFPVKKIILAADQGLADVVLALQDYFENDAEIVANLATGYTDRGDLFDLQQKLFRKLDLRPVPAGPRISRWLLNRISRPEPKNDNTSTLGFRG